MISESNANSVSGSPANVDSLTTSPLLGKNMREIERWAIEQTLVLSGGNREETAKILGISERNLYRKLNEYNLRDVH